MARRADQEYRLSQIADPEVVNSRISTRYNGATAARSVLEYTYGEKLQIVPTPTTEQSTVPEAAPVTENVIPMTERIVQLSGIDGIRAEVEAAHGFSEAA